MQNEKYCFYYYNVFEYNHVIEKVFYISDEVFLVFGVLDNSVYSYEIDYYEFLLTMFVFYQYNKKLNHNRFDYSRI